MYDEYHQATANSCFDRLMAERRAEYHDEAARLNAEVWWAAASVDERERLMAEVASKGVVEVWFAYRAGLAS